MPKKSKSSPSSKKTVASSAESHLTAKRMTTGIILAVILIIITLACVSYIFTYASDSIVPEGGKYANIIGQFGSFISNFIMGRMGFSTYFMLSVGFMLSFNIAMERPVAPVFKTGFNLFLLSLWLSITLAYIPNDYYLTGSWGYRLHSVLEKYLGWGLVLVLFFAPIIWFIIVKRITPDKIKAFHLNRLERKELEKLEKLDIENDLREKAARISELKKRFEEKALASNQDKFKVEDFYKKEPETKKYQKDKQEEPCQPEEQDNIRYSWNAKSSDFDESEETELESDFEDSETNIEKEEILDHENNDGISGGFFIAKEEKRLDEEELSQKVLEQFGNYDPTLELSDYQAPPIELLKQSESEKIHVDKQEIIANRRKIVETLKNYNISITRIDSTIGPTVTLYEIVPAPGVKISKIKNLEDDIALSLSALGIRIIAPIPGKGTVGIEVPNKEPSTVSMYSAISSEKFQNSQMDLPVAIGKTISNETLCFDLAKMPHLLMAGATGQGKSVGLNAVLTSLLYKKHPSQVKFVLVDPKKVELTLYNKIERHFLAKLPGNEDAIITDNAKVIKTLNSLCQEMDNRYELLKNAFVRNIKEYNDKFIKRKLNPEKGHRYLPYIVLVVDEFADLIMTAGKEVEMPIARLAQLARAIGIHLIIATQRPSVNVITGIIKANFPARIAFRVTSKIDSRTILDASGADQLIGKGDMLFSSQNEIIRVQCAFIDTPEVEEICEFIGSQRAYPSAMLLPEPESLDFGEDSLTISSRSDEQDLDPRFEEAARCVVALQQGSASVLQRKMSLGYNRAGRIVDQLEAAGIIGGFNGAKGREVLIQDESSLNSILNKILNKNS